MNLAPITYPLHVPLPARAALAAVRAVDPLPRHYPQRPDVSPAPPPVEHVAEGELIPRARPDNTLSALDFHLQRAMLPQSVERVSLDSAPSAGAIVYAAVNHADSSERLGLLVDKYI
jgi:hypothetical protein